MKNVLLFLIINFAHQGVAQNLNFNYIIPFEHKIADINTHNITQEIISGDKIADFSFLKGIPLTVDTFALYSVTINKEQELYNRFLDGKISHADYLKRMQIHEIDTTLLVNRFDGKNQFYLYVGLNKEKRFKYVVVDCNNNNDFSDDKLYTFSLDDYNSSFERRDSLRPRIQVEADFYDGKNKRIILTILNFVLDPFDAWYGKDSYTFENEYYLNVILLTNHYMEGVAAINGKKVTVYEHKTGLNSKVSINMDRHSRFRFYIEGDSIFPKTFKVGDSIAVAGRMLYLEKVENNQLYLQSLSALSDSSTVGAQLPNLYSNNLLDNREIHLNRLMKDKYVFVDFWGSWCHPCVASLPKLVQLYNVVRNRNDVLMLGIALENEKDVEKLKQIISDNNVTWLNVWNPMSSLKSLSSLHGKLGITQYPTYLIVDKAGKIVYNTKFISNSRENAIDFFLDLIK